MLYICFVINGLRGLDYHVGQTGSTVIARWEPSTEHNTFNKHVIRVDYL